MRKWKSLHKIYLYLNSNIGVKNQIIKNQVQNLQTYEYITKHKNSQPRYSEWKKNSCLTLKFEHQIIIIYNSSFKNINVIYTPKIVSCFHNFT